MNNTHSFYFLKKKLSRPSTARSMSNTRVVTQLSLQIVARKINPLSRIPKQVDIGTSPMIFEPEIQNLPIRRKIVVVKTPKDLEESPSVLVSEDIVKQYTKFPEPVHTKKRCPLSFLAIPLPPSSLRYKTHDPISLSSRSQMKHLKKEAFLKKNHRKLSKPFNHNEIITISHAKILLK